MIEVMLITKRYGSKKALDRVSLVMREGIYGLIGENGAGKTTLLHILAGILEPDEGQVIFEGQDIGRYRKQYNHTLGYMPQSCTYYKDFSVEEFLLFMCAMKEIPKASQKERVERVLTQVNLLDERKKKIGALSGGMRQRMGIAQAILNEPRILILDEPTAGLDPYERMCFRELLRELADGKAILLATHITQDIEELADQVIMLHRGKVLACDSIGHFRGENLETVFIEVINGQ